VSRPGTTVTRGGQLQVKNYFIGLQVRVQVPPRVNCGPIRYNNGQVQGGGAVVGADVSWTYPNLDHHATLLAITRRAARQTLLERRNCMLRPRKSPGQAA
jgi:hypothetical protein